jgi:hypothetical protein
MEAKTFFLDDYLWMQPGELRAEGPSVTVCTLYILKNNPRQRLVNVLFLKSLVSFTKMSSGDIFLLILLRFT